MHFDEFKRVAHEAFESIPARFREGVDGLDVRLASVPHPTLTEVFTLGECLTEQYPGEFGGPGEVRSIVVLYYGSFLELSRLDEEWDWEAEIHLTVIHEVRHHRESLALDDSLEEIDYAEDQNFARLEGRGFDPFFYQRGTPLDDHVWEVGGDHFVEVPVGRREIAAGAVRVCWGEHDHTLPVHSPIPDLHFVRLDSGASGDLYAVLHRRRTLIGWISALLRPRPLEVRES